jgi:hypothetical protein
MTLVLNGTTGVSAVDGSASTPAIQGNDSNTGMFFPAADTIAFAEGGTEVMRIDSSGNVGIGQSTTPSVFTNYKSLYLHGSSGSAIQMQYGGSLASNIVADSNAMYLQNITALVFGTGGTGTGTERARIDSSGNLLVGTTNATGDGTGIELRPNTENGGFFTVKKSSSSVSGDKFVMFTRNGSVIGSISQNGTTGVTYSTSSDYRLKENVAPMTGALAKVASLKPVTYKWKADGSDGQGFIAHELQAVVPDCVVGEKDAVDAEGNPIYQGIDTSFLVATLTAALQELKAELDAAKTRIAALEGAAS